MNKRIVISGGGGAVGQRLLPLFVCEGFELMEFKPGQNVFADRFIHLAARSCENSAKLVESNIVYLQLAIDYCRKNSIDEFIFFSAISVYGTPDCEGLEESSPLFAPGLYGISKLFGEKMLEKSGLKVLVIRLPALLTAKVQSNVICRWYRKLTRDENIVIANPDKLFNNFILVDEIFDFIKQVKIKNKFDIVNLACEKSLTLVEIIACLKQLTDSKSTIEISRDSGNFFNISTKKAEIQYGFTPVDPRHTLKRWTQIIKETQS